MFGYIGKCKGNILSIYKYEKLLFYGGVNHRSFKFVLTNDTDLYCSGDMDGRVPVTSTRYSVNSLKLPIKTHWYPWLTDEEVFDFVHYNFSYYNVTMSKSCPLLELQVGGYAVEYEGLVFATVRGAGHFVPSYQPERALTMISSFLRGKLPPAAL